MAYSGTALASEKLHYRDGNGNIHDLKLWLNTACFTDDYPYFITVRNASKQKRFLPIVKNSSPSSKLLVARRSNGDTYVGVDYTHNWSTEYTKAETGREIHIGTKLYGGESWPAVTAYLGNEYAYQVNVVYPEGVAAGDIATALSISSLLLKQQGSLKMGAVFGVFSKYSTGTTTKEKTLKASSAHTAVTVPIGASYITAQYNVSSSGNNFIAILTLYVYSTTDSLGVPCIGLASSVTYTSTNTSVNPLGLQVFYIPTNYEPIFRLTYSFSYRRNFSE